MKLPVTVTRSHIRNGVAKDANACALALALTEQYGGRWTVGGNYAHRGLRTYRLDAAARRIPQKFDQHEHIRSQIVAISGPCLAWGTGPRNTWRTTHKTVPPSGTRQRAPLQRFDSSAELAVAVVYGAGLGIVRGIKALRSVSTRGAVTAATEAQVPVSQPVSQPQKPQNPQYSPEPAAQPGSDRVEPVPVRVRVRADGTEELEGASHA